VVFVRNTTEALNLVCDGLRLGPEDVVVVGYDAHHSNLLPWRRRSRVAHLRVLGTGRPDLEHYEELLARRPRVVALNHCSNLTGVLAPVQRMAAQARDAGATVVLDMAQSLPHRRVSVRELAVDFAAFSGHKLLGPTGIGVLYGRHDQLARLEPAHLGGGTIDWVDDDRFVLRALPHRLEGGTPHIAGAYGLHAALRYLDRLGWEAVAAHGAALAALMVAEAARRPYLRTIVEPDDQERTSILSFTLQGRANLDETARTLSDAYGVMCRSGHMCAQPFVDDRAGHQVLRASAYLYNTADDVQRLFAALDDLCS
jgi:cysteine desulfurase/selenocysteine lyase